jgi:putative alpha-1,2-mannosidase
MAERLRAPGPAPDPGTAALTIFLFDPTTLIFPSPLSRSCWGQYEHDNQPVHHMLWMPVGADNNTQGRCAAITQYWTRQVTSLLYRPGADYATGDEDNGQLSTWYLLGVLGLYSLAPGTNDLLLGSPLFSHVSVSLQGGGSIEIVAVNNCPTCYYVASVSWNGQAITGNSVDYAQLMKGGTLQFTMTSTAPKDAKIIPNAREGQLRAESAASRAAWHSGRKTLLDRDVDTTEPAGAPSRVRGTGKAASKKRSA